MRNVITFLPTLNKSHLGSNNFKCTSLKYMTSVYLSVFVYVYVDMCV